MPDVFSKKKRSEVMSLIRSTGNKNTELALAHLFRRHRITGWRRQIKLKAGKQRATTGSAPSGKNDRPRRLEPARSLSVRPDFVFRRERVALFVDGCFWHGCERHCRMPTGNRRFWKEKITRNMRRDDKVTRALKRQGWRVVRIWEHELARKNEARLLARLRHHLVFGDVRG